MNKSYNNNEQLDMLNDLKNLPKIKTPDNFEYNLMTKIQNKNFGLTIDNEYHFNWVKFFAPSALIISLVLVFFIFFSHQNREIKSEGTIAKRIETQPLVNIPTISNKKLTDQTIADNHRTVKSEEVDLQNSKPENSSLESQENNPITNRKPIVLDEYISGHNKQKDDLTQGNVIREGGESANLSGLIESKKLDRKTLKIYRALVDSIKRADSLKKALK
jgi:hypothetical protein